MLEDGSVWKGKTFGSVSEVSGEVVFNTGMVGYPESVTDPSYQGQILCQTYPLIGNYGVCSRDFESGKPRIRGYVVSEFCGKPSHASSEKSLDEWLREEGVPGICGIDTRSLTKRLRVHGVMLGLIGPYKTAKDIGAMRIRAKEVPDPNRRDLVREVSVREPLRYGQGSRRVVLIDCGAKENIVRCLVRRGLEVIRVPHDMGARRIMDYEPSGIMISNGPGDPKMCRDTIKTVKDLLTGEVPIFGICLGNQILTLAAGGDTYKLKFGHRGQNQPCIEEGTKRCYITSQNHGFAADTDSLPAGWRPWFRNANDGTNEGIIHKTRPFMSVQFHPEACPGPVDTEFLFDRFVRMMEEGK